MDLGRLDHVGLLGISAAQCGIATSTTDTFHALKDRFPDLTVDVYAMDDRPRRLRLPSCRRALDPAG